MPAQARGTRNRVAPQIFGMRQIQGTPVERDIGALAQRTHDVDLHNSVVCIHSGLRFRMEVQLHREVQFCTEEVASASLQNGGLVTKWNPCRRHRFRGWSVCVRKRTSRKARGWCWILFLRQPRMIDHNQTGRARHRKPRRPPHQPALMLGQ